MILTLYKTSDSFNVINKTLSDPLSFNINLRKDFNISNPIIRLEPPLNSGIMEYNYLHMPELNRYYLIEEIKSINYRVWELICSCDVLETYKTEILNSFCKYWKPVSNGDFGPIQISSTGKNLVQNLESDTEMVLSENSILSIYGAV